MSNGLLSVCLANKKNLKIEFKWVKAHTEKYGNEIEDRLAKEATQNYYVTCQKAL